MRKEILVPAVAVIGGGAGFALRRWGLSTGFEPDTGLPIPGAPANLALIALSVAVAVLLVLLCEIRRPRPLTRGRGTVLVLAALMAFPMGFGLNLALTRQAYPDQGTVVEVEPPEPEQDYASLTFRWEGRRYTATWYGAVSDLPQPEEAVDLCIRESPLGIHMVSVNC